MAEITLPLIVKCRMADRSASGTHCDTVAHALEIADEFRAKGFTEVWIEDHAGRIIDEAPLRA
jgi:hypothetical protein